nr:MAG TPA: hypothetical protein [Caudoviricetes sp.]
MLLIDCDSCIKLDCYYNTVNEVFQVIKISAIAENFKIEPCKFC